MTDIIETMARALWIAQAVGIDDPALAWDSPEKTEHPLYWLQRMDDNRPAYIAAAQAALTAITEAGYVVVPREPTEAMLAAGEYDDGHPQGEYFGGCRLADSWERMIRASNNGKAE